MINIPKRLCSESVLSFVSSSSLSTLSVEVCFTELVTKGDSRRPGELMSLTQAAAMHGDQGDHSLTWQSESHGISQLHVNSHVHKAEKQECYRNIFGYVILLYIINVSSTSFR